MSEATLFEILMSLSFFVTLLVLMRVFSAVRIVHARLSMLSDVVKQQRRQIADLSQRLSAVAPLGVSPAVPAPAAPVAPAPAAQPAVALPGRTATSTAGVKVATAHMEAVDVNVDSWDAYEEEARKLDMKLGSDFTYVAKKR